MRGGGLAGRLSSTRSDNESHSAGLDSLHHRSQPGEHLLFQYLAPSPGGGLQFRVMAFGMRRAGVALPFPPRAVVTSVTTLVTGSYPFLLWPFSLHYSIEAL